MRVKDRWDLICSLLIVGAVSGCISGERVARDLHPGQPKEQLTAGLVQKQIRVGMSQAEVVAALNEPNTQTRDSEGKVTWIYDKIASTASYSGSSVSGGGSGGAAGLIGSVLTLGGVSASASKSVHADDRARQTLTVVIKFDKSNLVEAFSYHASKF